MVVAINVYILTLVMVVMMMCVESGGLQKGFPESEQLRFSPL